MVRRGPGLGWAGLTVGLCGWLLRFHAGIGGVIFNMARRGAAWCRLLRAAEGQRCESQPAAARGLRLGRRVVLPPPHPAPPCPAPPSGLPDRRSPPSRGPAPRAGPRTRPPSGRTRWRCAAWWATSATTGGPARRWVGGLGWAGFQAGPEPRAEERGRRCRRRRPSRSPARLAAEPATQPLPSRTGQEAPAAFAATAAGEGEQQGFLGSSVMLVQVRALHWGCLPRVLGRGVRGSSVMLGWGFLGSSVALVRVGAQGQGLPQASASRYWPRP